MLLHGLAPGMQDHGKANFTAEIFLPKFFEQLSGSFNEEIEKTFLIESQQRIEDMVQGEDHMIIMDRQNPFLLGFEPLRLLEGATLWAVAVLAGFVVKLPTLTCRTSLQHTAHGRGAAIHDRTHGFGLFIGKLMSAFVFSDMLSENIRNFVVGRL